MRATKIKFRVELEVLSMDSIPGLLKEISERLLYEQISGKLYYDDGDTLDWHTEKKEVEF